MRVMIIPEDFRRDQHLLKPLFERLFAEIRQPKTHIYICQDPLLGGVVESLKSTRLREVVDRYPMMDLFILCVDRDGIETRRHRLDQIEREFGLVKPFLAENAWEELETWILAGLDLPKDWSWLSVRAEVSVKERYFDLLAQQLNVSREPGGGRKPLGEQAARNIRAIRQKCPEDFDRLAIRIEALVAG